MNPAPFKLALAQIHITPGDRARNLDRALTFIQRAAAAGAQIVLLPEALPFGWMDSSAQSAADEIPSGATCRALADAAHKSGIFVCSGLIERADQKIFNAAVLIDPSGEVILHHRKINELEIAHHLYALGDRLAVTDTPFGKIGLMICADAFIPGQTISRALAFMGAQIILSPCAWAVPPTHDHTATPYGKLWLDNYAPVCRDFHLWIAGCSNVGPIHSGPWQGHHCIGNSLVLSPTGKTELQAPHGPSAEELLLVEITPTPQNRPNGQT